MPDVALQVSGVTAGYGGSPVIEDVTVSVAAGQIVAIVGPNGAGKSTLLKSLAGLVKISAGTVHVAGKDITGTATERLAGMGVSYVPQVANIFPGMTVRENLEMGGYRRRSGSGNASRRCANCSRTCTRRSAARPGRSAAVSAACSPWPAA